MITTLKRGALAAWCFIVGHIQGETVWGYGTISHTYRCKRCCQEYLISQDFGFVSMEYIVKKETR